MPGFDPSQKLHIAAMPFQAATAVSAAAPQGSASPVRLTATESGHGFSFHDFLDVINPLQHLPVVGTLYRAITGDKPGTLEKFAGDTLYGGLWGAVSSIADTAFEALTGKDMGSTVLALLTGDGDKNDKPATLLASAAPAPVPASAAAVPVAATPANTGDVTALSASLAGKGVTSDMAARALFAYRKSMAPVQMPVLASIN